MSGPADVALLKSWDFSSWQKGGGSALPYRIDYLERHGLRLRWSDHIHQSSWTSSRLGAVTRRVEMAGVPIAQTLTQQRAIRASPATLAMFESEANFLAATRRMLPPARRSAFLVISCWLAHILQNASRRRLSGYRWAYESVDRLYCLSENQVPVLVDLLDLPGDRIRFIPFGVDTEFFTPDPARENGSVLVVGRDRGRDWPTTFEALDGIGMPVKVCCRLSDLSGYDIPLGTEVLGYVSRDQYRRLLAEAVVVVVASKPVVYPSGQSVLLEAMAMGKAVVVTETTALSGYVDDGRTALSVEPGNADDLRCRVLEAAADPALRLRLGTAAHEDVRDRFSARQMWSNVAYDIFELIEHDPGSRPSRHSDLEDDQPRHV